MRINMATETTAILQMQLMASVSYLVLSRMGSDPRQYIQAAYFSELALFDTPETIAQFGSATTDVAELVIRRIGRMVRGIERRGRGTLANMADVSHNKDRTKEKGGEYGVELRRSESYLIPKLKMDEQPAESIGKRGMTRKTFPKEHRKEMYSAP